MEEVHYAGGGSKRRKLPGAGGINGALMKRFASGGDTLVARPLYHDPCMFKLSGRMLMCANDMPDVNPPDTCETLDYFESPSKFVDKDDERLGTHDMVGLPAVRMPHLAQV